MNTLKIKQLSESATLPTRSHPTDAGLDIYASEKVWVHNAATVAVPTGIAVDIPAGYEGTIRPRSGKTLKSSLRVHLGTVDSGYTGEIKVLCSCSNDIFAPINPGDKIAQLVISPIVTPAIEVVDDFNTVSQRGSNGFGSTDS